MIDRKTPEWYKKRDESRRRSEGRMNIDLDPAKRSWYYDDTGIKRDKKTGKAVDESITRETQASEESNQTPEQNR